MAKDVDLSSKEWRDIVFEGKNKEYGAYTLRAGSVQRHTKAVTFVLIGLAILLVFLTLSISGVFAKPEDEMIVTNTDQVLTTIDTEDSEDDIDEPEEFVLPPEPEEVIAPEEVANEQRITELLIVEDDQLEDDKQVKNQEEMIQNEAQAGAVDITEGTNDLNKVTITEQVIAEVKVEEEQPMSIAMVEQKPMFPGGEAAMYKFLTDTSPAWVSAMGRAVMLPPPSSSLRWAARSSSREWR